MLRKSIMFAAGLLLAAPAIAEPAPKRPNFLIIVADDLGFSDIGAFGGEIDTPNLDALARNGLRLTGFHTAPTCSPTRSMLLSGTDNHKAGLGSMAELLAPNQLGKPGHEGYLRPDIASLAELLSAGGYRTLFSGKWHLGLTPAQDPHARGFQHSFALLQGGHNHFGLNLSDDPTKGYTYREDGITLTSLPANFYSSDTFASKLIEELKGASTGAEGAKPFFAYLAFTAPHWPLQAPEETIAKYHGRYDKGFEVLRAERLKRQAALGLLDPATVAHPLELKKDGWGALSSDEQRVASREMEIYAAMVDRLDQNVGRVIAALKASGEFENTVIFFLADNGAEGMDLTTVEMPMIRNAVASADNSFDNLGKATSYVGYGPGWAQAATAPSWLYKAFATEGGTRTTAFITGPNVKRVGGISSTYTNVMDVTPTLLDLAGIPRPKGTFEGRPVQPILGTSWVPWLERNATTVHATDQPIGTELFGSRALRQGDWKITDKGDGQWHLFDIARDPGETKDLSTQEPARKSELVAAWDTYARNVGVVMPDTPTWKP
jgi:arylsulfatase